MIDKYDITTDTYFIVSSIDDSRI